MPGTTDNSQQREDRIRSVGELARDFSARLDRDWPLIWVRGEISGARRPGASGHYYFTLKDDKASFSAVLWRGRAQSMQILPRDGLQVEAQVRLVFYGRAGRLQLDIQQFRRANEGELMRAFLERRDRLQAEGLFDPDRKQILPVFPRRIGLLTARTGAALRDMIHVFQRRHPSIELILQDTPVQGDHAGTELSHRLRRLWRQPGLDLIILGRGGGSFEDLFCFSDEGLVRAIAECPLPVISAVGHEIDTPLSDLVADLRAPTPTAAAELSVPDDEELKRLLLHLKQRGETAFYNRRQHALVTLQALKDHYAFRDPLNRLQQSGQNLDDLRVRLRRETLTRYQGYRTLLPMLSARLKRRLHHLHQLTTDRLRSLPRRLERLQRLSLERALTSLDMGRKGLDQQTLQTLERHRQRFGIVQKRLEALDASRVRELAKRLGMTQVRDGEGQALLQAADFHIGQHFQFDYSDGTVKARVENTSLHPKSHMGEL
jgi:exodeoxyribonuclease VII large subunit